MSNSYINTYVNARLIHMDRSMIDAMSGEALVNKTPEKTRNVIATMDANGQ